MALGSYAGGMVQMATIRERGVEVLQSARLARRDRHLGGRETFRLSQ